MIDTVKKFVNGNGQLFVNLAERWLGEKQYENIADYQKVIQKKADEHGITIKKMLKQPFGFSFVMGGFEYVVKVKMKASTAFLSIEEKKRLIYIKPSLN